MIAESGAEAVFWNRRYEAAHREQDRLVQTQLAQQGVPVHDYQSGLLFAPGTVLNKEGLPFRVFTPFWQACQKLGLSQTLLPAPAQLHTSTINSLSLADLKLLPSISWGQGLQAEWQAGEAQAHRLLQAFCEQALNDYPQARDEPGINGTSRLSPHLAFGEITPRQIINALLEHFICQTKDGGACDHYLRELGWREFAHHCLYHFPQMTSAPLNRRFAAFPWRHNPALLRAWQQGKTGFPIIDAGMRQLWHTGWMHNRVRMIVASFLTKNALIDWRLGAEWFWDTLVDADLASNSFNWQWVAGCGLDAAPYFRIFNPVTQSEKLDAHGRYLRRWLPELSTLPAKWLHQPWKTPETIQEECSIRIGIDYPTPILDLGSTRQQALLLHKQLPKLH